MKIFHGTIEIAGQMGILSGEQKKEDIWLQATTSFIPIWATRIIS